MPHTLESRRLSSADTIALARSQARHYLACTLGFADCPAATLEALVAGGQLKELAAETYMARQGDPFDMLAVIVRGSLNFCQLRTDGQRCLLAVQCAGDTVGYVPMVDGSLYPYDIYARTDDTQVLLIPGDHVRQVRLLDQSIGRAIEIQLAYRMRLVFAKMTRDTRQPIDVRLAGTLVTWAKRYGVQRGGQLVIEQKVSQVDFADILGASRQRINFAIRELVKAKLVEMRYACIVIHDLARLTEYAGEVAGVAPTDRIVSANVPANP